MISRSLKRTATRTPPIPPSRRSRSTFRAGEHRGEIGTVVVGVEQNLDPIVCAQASCCGRARMPAPPGLSDPEIDVVRPGSTPNLLAALAYTSPQMTEVETDVEFTVRLGDGPVDRRPDGRVVPVLVPHDRPRREPCEFQSRRVCRMGKRSWRSTAASASESIASTGM